MAQAGSSHPQAGALVLADRDVRRDSSSRGLSLGVGALAKSPSAVAAMRSPQASGGSHALPPPSSNAPMAASPAASNAIASPPIPPQDNPSAAAERTRTPSYGERTIAEAELLCFANPRPGRPFEISIELPEFTCKCPFSGYPDFAVLRLIYQPGPRVVELKAIKLYINSYRDRSISHEEVTNRILDDLVEACEPVWMELTADFNPRGNVHTVVRVSHGTRQPC